MSEPALRRFETWDGLVQAAAEALGGALEHALRERGSASLALAGGGTPADIYRRLSHRELDWPRVSVTPTDERWVEADSPESNARLVRETLLQGRAASARLLPLKEEGRPTPEAAAQGAEAALAAVWPLDAVLLGMGGDGHFASLFPGSASLPAGLDPCGDRRVISVPAGTPAPTQPRLSLTLAAAVGSLILGTLIAAMRVSPVPPLRWLGTGYVQSVRNTPLSVVFFLVVFGLPEVDVILSVYRFAVIALTLYTAAFV
ncbi:MAG: 6-phosphogluconolactonase, partial [Proteobacteria bacterium]|nr:6-phosphogluconolactonase [Pseudomonadota bacterium]